MWHDLVVEDLRGVGLYTADHSQVVETQETTASERQVEHLRSWLVIISELR